ncbi:hypothetical protein MPER_03536 [Moniliophthora perniciosa FA553]|nr:hypothetical protein MPER_03536 [Moniliophthora perniciosa FA553]
MADTSTTPHFALLTNSNYPEWRRNAQAYLMKLGYWKLVSGKDTKPDDDKAGSWETKAEKAAGEIFLLVDENQKVHIGDSQEDPVKMWKILESVHVSKVPGARFNAYDDLFSIQKKDNESLVELGVRVEKAMVTIRNLQPSSFTVNQLDEELQAMALIRALPTEFQTLSTSLLLKDKLDKDTILQAFRSDELNRQRQTEQVN